MGRRAVHLVAVAALALGVAGCGSRPEPAKSTTPSPSLSPSGSPSPSPVPSASPAGTAGALAWIARNGVAVRTADGRVQALARFAAADAGYGLRWSADGRRLGWLQTTAKGTGVAVHDFATGRLWTGPPDEYADPPLGMEPLRAGFGVLAGGTLRVYTPAAAGTVTVGTVRTNLPASTEPRYAPFPLAGLGDRLLVGRSGEEASAYGGPMDVYALGVDGRARVVFRGGDTDNLPVFAAAADARGRSVGYATGTTAGRCVETYQRVEVRDTSRWAVVPTPGLPAAGAGLERAVVALSYGTAGPLVAVLDVRPSDCEVDRAPAPEAWALRNGSWVRLRQPAKWAAFGPDGRLAVVRPPPAPDGDLGRLEIVDARGVAAKVADDVREARWSPS